MVEHGNLEIDLSEFTLKIPEDYAQQLLYKKDGNTYVNISMAKELGEVCKSIALACYILNNQEEYGIYTEESAMGIASAVVDELENYSGEEEDTLICEAKYTLEHEER